MINSKHFKTAIGLLLLTSLAHAHPQETDGLEQVPEGSILKLSKDLNFPPNTLRTYINDQIENLPGIDTEKEFMNCYFEHNESEQDRSISKDLKIVKVTQTTNAYESVVPGFSFYGYTFELNLADPKFKLSDPVNMICSYLYNKSIWADTHHGDILGVGNIGRLRHVLAQSGITLDFPAPTSMEVPR